MNEQPPGYAVGYGKPPLHSRFRKGTSGNPQGGRRRAKPLGVVLQEVLDQPAARTRMRRRARRQITRREAIVAGLVDKSAAGDLPATRLLLELDLKTERAASPAPFSDEEEDPREFLKRELDRLAAGVQAGAENGSDSEPSSDEPGAPSQSR